MTKPNYLTIKTAINIPNTSLKGVEEVILFEKYCESALVAIAYAEEFKKVNRDFQVLTATYNMHIYI